MYICIIISLDSFQRIVKIVWGFFPAENWLLDIKHQCLNNNVYIFRHFTWFFIPGILHWLNNLNKKTFFPFNFCLPFLDLYKDRFFYIYLLDVLWFRWRDRGINLRQKGRFLPFRLLVFGGGILLRRYPILPCFCQDVEEGPPLCGQDLTYSLRKGIFFALRIKIYTAFQLFISIWLCFISIKLYIW